MTTLGDALAAEVANEFARLHGVIAKRDARVARLEEALRHIERACNDSGNMDDEYLNNIMLIHDIARAALEVQP